MTAADQPKPDKPAAAKGARDGAGPARPGERPSCGVIMPISPTANFGADHWLRVRTLLHRVIDRAGFDPKNVWEGSATDRISKRVVANLFSHPLVVADISELNPNVMLELGLRLSSKKATIIVACSGSAVPFDIKDFEYLEYPSNLNIIDMEAFFDRFVAFATERYEAQLADTYSPFLADVVIDVLNPTERKLPAEDLILARLEDLSRQVSEAATRTRERPSSMSSTTPTIEYKSLVSKDKLKELLSELKRQGFEFDYHIVSEQKNDFVVRISTIHPTGDVSGARLARLRSIISSHSRVHMPERVPVRPEGGGQN